LRVGGLGEPDAVEQLVRPRLPRLARERLEGSLEPQVLAAGEQRVERGLLQRGADRGTDLRSFANDVVAGDPRRASGRCR